MKKPHVFHFAFKIEYSMVVRELITDAKIKLPTALAGRANRAWIDVMSIWDTGATNSVITRSVVEKLKLVPTGKATVLGVNSREIRDTYMVDIGLPNHVIMPDVIVTECNINSPNIDLLIGMNIIRRGDLAISNGSGHTIFSFAIPPFKKPVDLYEKSIAVNPKRL